MLIQICVGSSCHLTGSPEIVKLFQQAIQEHHLEQEVTLAGTFCVGKCNRIGVTVQIDEDIHVNVTKETFPSLFQKHVLEKLIRERN